LAGRIESLVAKGSIAEKFREMGGELKKLDTKSGKMVGVSRQTANQHNIMISLKFYHSLKREFLQELLNSMLLASLYVRFQSI